MHITSWWNGNLHNYHFTYRSPAEWTYQHQWEDNITRVDTQRKCLEWADNKQPAASLSKKWTPSHDDFPSLFLVIWRDSESDLTWLLTLFKSERKSRESRWLCNWLGHIFTHNCQHRDKQWGQLLPHLHVFLLQDGRLLGEDLIGLDTLQAMLPLLLLQRKGPLTIYWAWVSHTLAYSDTSIHNFDHQAALQTLPGGLKRRTRPPWL